MPNTLDYYRLNVEGMIAHVGLPGEFDWSSGKNDFQVTVFMPFDEVPEVELRARLSRFQTLIEDAATVSGLTLTNVATTDDLGILYILQIVKDIHLESLVRSGTMDMFVNQLAQNLEYELKKRRPKRKKGELPDPSKAPNAYVNVEPLRKTFQLGARVSKETIDQISELGEKHNKTKRQIVEEAVALYARNLESGPD